MTDQRANGPDERETSRSSPDVDAAAGTPGTDPSVVLLRLLVGGAVEGATQVAQRLSQLAAETTADEGTSAADSVPERARYALIGLLFEAYGRTREGLTAATRLGATVGRLWWAVLGPVVRSPALSPLRRPYEALLERGAAEVDRWVRVGRAEEVSGRDLARRLTRAPIDDVMAYLQQNPELEALVRKHADALLEELADDSRLQNVIRDQGDEYIEHLQENPEAVQALIEEQSLGLAGQVTDAVRARTVTADALLEGFVRAVLRRQPREQLPDPPSVVLDQAEAARRKTDEG